VTNPAKEGLMARKASLERRVKALLPIVRDRKAAYDEAKAALDRDRQTLEAVKAMLRWKGPDEDEAA
jgi:hypothetical protein